MKDGGVNPDSQVFYFSCQSFGERKSRFCLGTWENDEFFCRHIDFFFSAYRASELRPPPPPLPDVCSFGKVC